MSPASGGFAHRPPLGLCPWTVLLPPIVTASKLLATPLMVRTNYFILQLTEKN